MPEVQASSVGDLQAASWPQMDSESFGDYVPCRCFVRDHVPHYLTEMCVVTSFQNFGVLPDWFHKNLEFTN
jgi:hypothetical protein